MKGRESVPVGWKIAVTILVLLCLGLAIALIVVALDYNDYKDKYPGDVDQTAACAEGLVNDGDVPKSQGLFDDLSSDEIVAVRDFLLKQSALSLKNISEASVSDNYIYMIKLQPPAKDAVLSYLDGNGAKPAREALVVTFRGADKPSPVVQEYVVGQLNDTDNMNMTNRAALSFNVRPYDHIQQKAMEKIVTEATNVTSRLLNESYDGYHYYNCTKRCLKFRVQGPFGKDRNDRTTWVTFYRDILGEYLYPVDFQLYINFKDSNASNWKIEKIYYDGRVFNTLNDPDVKSFIPAPKSSDVLFSSFARRETLENSQKPMRPPRMFEPDGKRYTVSGRHIEYMSWSFDFRVDSVSGLQIYDVQFNKTRIVYELSLQEAISFYSGFSPYFMSANFVYGGWSMGAKSFELVGGVDCPETSKFFDVVHFADTGRPQTFKNAVCVFEMDSGIPMRRHFESNEKGGYKFYGGLANHALVIRTITSVHHYDNIYDFVFYQNGAIEVKATPTGYLQAENEREPSTDPYGQRIHTGILGNLHDHMFHYKVDLDVHGRVNSFETLEIRSENIPNQWFPPDRINQKRIDRQATSRESETAFKDIDFDQPTFYNVFSDKTNKFGSKQGYLIQHQKTARQMLPEGQFQTKMAPWSTYPLVVTQYKAGEQRSSSLYNQNSPTDPIVDFEDFFGNNDNVENQDLVAWVSLGIIEIPSAEDVPNILTTGNSASFFLRPFNYFDEDPSMASRNAVFIQPADKKSGSGEARVERYGSPDGKACMPRKYDMNFKGTSE